MFRKHRMSGLVAFVAVGFAWTGAAPAWGALADLMGEEDPGPLICDVSKEAYEALEPKVAEFEGRVEAAEKINQRGPNPLGIDAMVAARQARRESDFALWEFDLRCEPYRLLRRRKYLATQRFDQLVEKLWPECPKANESGWRDWVRKAEPHRRDIVSALKDPVNPVRAFQAYLKWDQLIWTYGMFFRGRGGGRYHETIAYENQHRALIARAQQVYRDHLRQQFQERYTQHLAETRLDYAAMADQVEAALATYSPNGGQATYRNATRPAVELVCLAWPEVVRELGINMRQALALAYPLDNSRELEATPADPTPANPWTESTQTIDGYSKAVQRIWAAMIELAGKDLEAGGQQRYLAYMQRLPELVARVGTGWPEYHKLREAFDAAVQGDATLKKHVDRYVELTERLLFWRETAGSAALRAALRSGAPDPQPGPMFLVPTEEHDKSWKTEGPSVAERYSGQQVGLPRMRMFPQPDGSRRLVSPWLGRGLFVLPAQPALVDRLNRAQAALAAELATGSRPQPLSVPASVAAGTAAQGPFPAVAGKVVRIRELPFIYSLAHLSTAETVLGEQRPTPRPADLQYTLNYLFILEPVCIQTTGRVVTP